MEIRVYPEYYEGSLLGEGIEIYGEFTSDKFSRMKLVRDGKLEICYDKVATDGKNIGARTPFAPQIYEVENLALGMICCSDIQDMDVVYPIRERLNTSKCKNKLIVVSAFMTNESWFRSDKVEHYLRDVHILLANGCDYGVASFVTNINGDKLSENELRFADVRVLNCGKV